MSDAQQTIELLRFNTCGSVDDGKSTLIGRLLYDSKSIMEDQMEALERSADITGGGQVNQVKDLGFTLYKAPVKERSLYYMLDNVRAATAAAAHPPARRCVR